MARGLAAALAVGVCALLLATNAEAHANYVRSNPAADARLVKAPTEVRVQFGEPPEAKGSELAVFDVAGTRVDQNDLAPSGEENGLRVSLKPLGDGGYLVAWTAASSVDGHTTKGSFAFAVGNAPLPAIPDVGPAAPPPSPLEIAGRALSYAGIALGLGTAFFVLFVAPTGIEPRREFQLLRLAGALIAIGSITLLADQGARVPARLGALLAVRALAGLAVVGTSFALELARLRPVTALAGGGSMTQSPQISERPRRIVALAATVTAAATATLVSHAAASATLKEMALDLIHVIAISVWTGGVVALLRTVLLPARPDTVSDARALGATVWRFSLTALVSVGLLLATGTLQAFGRLVLIEDLFETPYGIALSVKIALLALALVLGGLNLLRWGPRLRALPTARAPRIRALTAARAALVRDTTVETVLFVGIVIAAASLTAFVPPAQASAAAYDETHRVSDLRLEMLIGAPSPGRNRFVLRVHRGLTPVQGAEKAALRFTMIEHDMGQQELIATERAPGEYVAEGSPTAMFGTWKIEAIVRLSGREDVRSVFTVRVPAPDGGGGTTSRVLSAPPYTLLVFAEPAQPQAGAPVAINVQLVDARGNPVTAKKLRASFDGPSGVPAIDGTEDQGQSPPGRYVISVSALTAGSWKIAIAIGTETSATYPLEVAR